MELYCFFCHWVFLWSLLAYCGGGGASCMIAIFHSDGIELSQAWAIQEKIDSYMAFYRSIHGNVFPKCHFLEDHVVDWIERWGFRFRMGLHGHGMGSKEAKPCITYLRSCWRVLRIWFLMKRTIYSLLWRITWCQPILNLNSGLFCYVGVIRNCGIHLRISPALQWSEWIILLSLCVFC